MSSYYEQPGYRRTGPEDAAGVVVLVGCEPVLVTATADEMLAWISSALKSSEIAFPEENGPIKWPKHRLFE